MTDMAIGKEKGSHRLPIRGRYIFKKGLRNCHLLCDYIIIGTNISVTKDKKIIHLFLHKMTRTKLCNVTIDIW